MSTAVWTLVIDRESDEGHGVEVFASYRDALAVLPARLPRHWARYVEHQQQHGLLYDEGRFLEWIEELGLSVEVVIEEHELEAGGVPARLAPEQNRPVVSELVGRMSLEELRHVAGAALHVASAYGGAREPQGWVVLNTVAGVLAPALPQWVPSIDDAEDEAGIDWWAQLRDAPSKVSPEPLPVWPAPVEVHLREHLAEDGFPFAREHECLACEDRADEERAEDEADPLEADFHGDDGRDSPHD